MFSFLTEYHRIPFDQAVRDLARKYQISLPEFQKHSQETTSKAERIYEINSNVADYYADVLKTHREAQSARDYLSRRGLSADHSALFSLGYALPAWDGLCQHLARQNVPLSLAEEAGLAVRRKTGGGGYYDRFRNRVMFPIFDLSGRVSGFGGRVLDDSLPKYLNSPETPVYHKGNCLYGLHLTRNELRGNGYGLIVEGYFDLVSLYLHGVKNVVATLGTALTSSHIRALKGYAEELVVLFDSDSAGVKAALRSIPLFLKEEVSARVMVLPAGHDPDTFIRSHSAEAFSRLVSSAEPLSTFLLQRLSQKCGKSIEGKTRLLNEIRPLVMNIVDPVQKALYVAEIAKYLDVSESLIEMQLRSSSATTTRSARVATGLVIDDANSYLERTIIEILLLHPQYIPALLEERGEGFIESKQLECVFDYLKGIIEKEGTADAGALLSSIEDPALKGRLTAIMVSAPVHREAATERVVQDVLATIRRRKQEYRTTILRERIKEAERTKQHQLVTELLQEQRELLGHKKVTNSIV